MTSSRRRRCGGFWSRQPDSASGHSCWASCYGDIFRSPNAKRFFPSFFGQGFGSRRRSAFSHAIRWDNTSKTKTSYSNELKAAIGTADPYESLRRESAGTVSSNLDTVGKAQYLETMIFLSHYLLSSQGDRVAMAHSIENPVAVPGFIA